jgi:hypothetical protein
MIWSVAGTRAATERINPRTDEYDLAPLVDYVSNFLLTTKRRYAMNRHPRLSRGVLALFEIVRLECGELSRQACAARPRARSALRRPRPSGGEGYSTHQRRRVGEGGVCTKPPSPIRIRWTTVEPSPPEGRGRERRQQLAIMEPAALPAALLIVFHCYRRWPRGGNAGATALRGAGPLFFPC